MKKRKSTCGLCKPHKKWKQNDTKAMRKLETEISSELAASSCHHLYLNNFRGNQHSNILQNVGMLS